MGESLLFLCFVMRAIAEVILLGNYHQRVGMPMAKWIKETEDKIHSRPVSGRRIVGGVIAPRNAYPYLGGLIITVANDSNLSCCGSSLISSDRLVTAAHCYRDVTHQAAQFLVVLGSQFLFKGGTRIGTSNVLVHPKYKPEVLHNDIAIIFLPRPVFFSKSIRPIELPCRNRYASLNGKWVIAAGFGRSSDAQTEVSLSTVINHVRLKVISLAQCQYVFSSVIARPSNICTRGRGGVGICRGDSGGPLVINRKGKNVLVGVSSFGPTKGCQLGYPSAFTKVTSYYSFIRKYL